MSPCRTPIDRRNPRPFKNSSAFTVPWTTNRSSNFSNPAASSIRRSPRTSSRKSSHSGKEIAEILADFQVIHHRDDIWPVVASELGASMVDLRNWTPPEALLALVPAGTARLHGALPVNFDETGLYVALVDPLNPQTVEDLRFALGREIHRGGRPGLPGRGENQRLLRRRRQGDGGHPQPVRNRQGFQDHRGPRGRGQLRADHPLRRSGALSGDQGEGLGHPLRALRKGLQDPLPGGRLAL